MRKIMWLIAFLAFGIFGWIGEMGVGIFHEFLFGWLWTYYNGFYISPESFLFFGLMGCIGFKMFRMLLERVGYRIISEEEYGNLLNEVDYYDSELDCSIHALMA